MDSIAKDQTVQYILTMLDDMLQVRVTQNHNSAIFASFMRPFWLFTGRQVSCGDIQGVCAQDEAVGVVTLPRHAQPPRPFHRQPGDVWRHHPRLKTCLKMLMSCVTLQTARIIAKLACWSKELMDRSDLKFYLTWLKDQFKNTVSYLIVKLFWPLSDV